MLGEISKNTFGVVEKAIPEGRCAVVRHLGSTGAIGKTVHELYGQWSPESGEELRDVPCFFYYIKRLPTIAEHKQETDIYPPLR